MLLIGNYQKFLADDFRQQSLLEIPEHEVSFLEKVVYPFDEAYRISPDVPLSEYGGSADTPLPPPCLRHCGLRATCRR